MVRSFLGFFIAISFFALYASAFNVTAPASADVDVVNNIAANWTWFQGEPTKVTIHLFVYQEDVCVFGRANPVQSKSIQDDIRKAGEEGGKKVGIVTYQADKLGKYILCAYEDNTPPGGKFNLRSIANSSTFDVARSVVTQTATSISTTSVIPTLNSSATFDAASGSVQPKSKPSGGIIAGAVIGGVLLTGLLVAAFVIFRRIRYRRRVVAFHRDRMAIAPPTSTFTSGDMSEKGFTTRSISSFGDGFPRSPQSFSTQNTLQPLRRPPV